MSPRYDVFLSHSSADKPAVEKLARKLRAAGIEPFLDKWHLVPGRLWQRELEAGLLDSRSCAIFIGAEGFGPWETQEALVALDRGARDPDTGETLSTLEGHSSWVDTVAVVDGRRAVSGSSDGMLRVWDLDTGETLAVTTLDAPVSALAVAPNGRIVVAGDRSGRVHFFDLVSRSRRRPTAIAS